MTGRPETAALFFCRGTAARTRDLLLPKQARYQLRHTPKLAGYKDSVFFCIFAFRMDRHILIKDLESIDSAAREFLAAVHGNRLIAFFAPMGAGKTTFTTAICRALGVKADAVSSPTFAIVNEYRTGDGKPVYHFDFYRIAKASEALDIGLYDYLDSGALCLMEWPENVEELLPDETLRVNITVQPDGSRMLTWSE